MRPTIWGRHIWFTIHYTALGYPIQPSEDDKNNAHTFYLTMGKILPCIKCRNNFAEHIEKLALDDTVLASRNNLFAWTVALHNEVNRATGKPVEWTVEQALEFYKNYTGKSALGHMPTCKTTNVIFVCAMLVLAVLVMLWANSKRRR